MSVTTACWADDRSRSLRCKTNLPTTQTNNKTVSLSNPLLSSSDRRATPHFTTDPVPDDFLEAILTFGGQAPTGYNLQPWRFIVVRDAENRKRLQSAAGGQSKVAEAPVVIIAIGVREDWSRKAEEVLREGAERVAAKSRRLESEAERGRVSFPHPKRCLAQSTRHDCCYRHDASR